MTDTIGRDELKAKIDRGDKFRLVETLAEEKFREGHLPGAVNLPPDRVGQLAPKLLGDKETEVVVYCGSSACDASEKAAQALAGQGYKHVRRYVGGKQDWVQAGLGTQSESPMASSTAT